MNLVDKKTCSSIIIINTGDNFVSCSSCSVSIHAKCLYSMLPSEKRPSKTPHYHYFYSILYLSNISYNCDNCFSTPNYKSYSKQVNF